MKANWSFPKWSAIILLLCSCAVAQTSAPSSRPDRTLVWSDEFNAPNGSPVDSSKWVLESGGNGWGNQELEYYTARPQNAFQQDGNLVIKVLEEKYTGTDGVTRNYTSARLKTQGKFAQKYGRFEARIKIPYGQGIWPAFWMLGDDIDNKGWPQVRRDRHHGEHRQEPAIVHGTIHGPGYSGGKASALLSSCRRASASPTTSTSSPSSGSPRPFASTSTITSIPRELPPTFRGAPSGYTSIRSSFC